MSLLRDMKLMSRDRIFLSRNKSVDLTGDKWPEYSCEEVPT